MVQWRVMRSRVPSTISTPVSREKWYVTISRELDAVWDQKTRSCLIFSSSLGSTVSYVYHGAAREDECVLSCYQRAYIEAEQEGTFSSAVRTGFFFANLDAPKLLDYDAARNKLRKTIDKPSEDPTKLPKVRFSSRRTSTFHRLNHPCPTQGTTRARRH